MNTGDHVEVFDGSGKLIINKRPTTPASTIDLSMFANGLYHISIKGGEKTRQATDVLKDN